MISEENNLMSFSKTDRDDTIRKEEVVTRRIAKLNMPAFLRKRLEKTATLKSDQQREAVVPIHDLNETLTPDTSVQSDSASTDKTLTPDTSAQSESASADKCSTRDASTLPAETASADNYLCVLPVMAPCPFSSKVWPAQVTSEDVNEAKYDHEIREGKVTDQKLDDTAVTSDDTFAKFEAGEEVALIGKETVPESELAPEPELAAEEAVGEDKGRESALPSSIDVKHLPTDDCDLELSYEDFIAQVDDTTRKEEVVDCRIAKLNIRAFLRKRLEKPTTLKSDQQREAVVPIQDLCEALSPNTSVQSESASNDKTWTPDTRVQSESASADNCSTRHTSTLPTETASADNYLSMLPVMAPCPVSSKVWPAQVFSEDTDEAKCDNEIREGKVIDQKLDDTAVTSDDTVAKFETGEEVALIDKETIPESELAPEPELATEEAVGEDKGRESAVPSSIDVKHIRTEDYDLELSHEDFIADEAQIETTEKESVPEPTSATTIDMKDAPNLTSTLEIMKEVKKEISNGRVTYADSITTLSDGEHHVFGINGHESEQDGFGISGRESKQDSVVPDATAFCFDPKFELELMGTLACTFADVLFDEKSIESTHGLDKNAALADDNSATTDNANIEQLNFDFYELRPVTSRSKVGFLKHPKKRQNKAKHKSGLKILTIATNTAIEMLIAIEGVNEEIDDTLRKLRSLQKRQNKAKNRSGNRGLKILTSETNMAIELSIAAEGVNEEIADTLQKLCSLQTLVAVTEPLNRKEAKAIAKPLRCKKTNVDADPLNGQGSNAGWSTTFWESEMMRMLENAMRENALLPKKDDATYQDDASCQSSLGHTDPDLESALFQVELDGTIVHIFADDDDPLHDAIEGQKGVRPDMTGGSTSTEDVSQTDDEAETPQLGDVVQVAWDSIEILETEPAWKPTVDRSTDSVNTFETKPLWKASVDQNSGRSYYYHRLTRETTWTTPPSFVDATAPVFVEAQNGARPDTTGGTTSTKDVSQTDDEADSPEIGQAVEVDDDSTKMPDAMPVWKATVDPNTGRSYYYHRLTRETTWMPPPDFVEY